MSVALSLLLIRGKHLAFILRRQDIRFDGAIIGRILKLGSPVALQDLLVNITFLVIIAIANSMGTIPSAGVGVAEKLCAFVMLVPSAYMQSMSAFVAQNIGAGLETRARRALLYGVLSSLMAGLLVGWAAFFHGDVLAGIFADDPAVIAAAWEYLKAYAIDCLLTSFLFCFVGFFNGCGQTLFVMAQGMVGALGVRLPVALLVSRAADSSLFHLGLATPCLHGGADFPVRNLVPAALPPAEPAGADTEKKDAPAPSCRGFPACLSAGSGTESLECRTEDLHLSLCWTGSVVPLHLLDLLVQPVVDRDGNAVFGGQPANGACKQLHFALPVVFAVLPHRGLTVGGQVVNDVHPCGHVLLRERDTLCIGHGGHLPHGADHGVPGFGTCSGP